ncbi:sodium-dependent phosphate transport protein [Kipferlia bialata]|uniref:Sodium-dependent phosphate transport protein n=1 Tax=Kipferlia bialata TaxID=797122 RepID=A0A391NUX2_9EUKA|nr:sodium-dependent phosphate transport protein [Kipferlia bialata]|eukprot:g7160.t1
MCGGFSGGRPAIKSALDLSSATRDMASTDTSDDLDVVTILFTLFGGLAVFLYGIEKMTVALKAMAGGGMQTVLGKLTTNRFTAALTGAIVTAVIQYDHHSTVPALMCICSGILL